ncbi:unnamed protein product [Moneuplotes crassus]|uniref:Uncharacterized protein n=1 Tax=Euplotes crassus TaxID=5936 RepID=A0AAD1X9W8_EUPCR|nr:unnamed protein product [Moneuplotes crassus]
MLFWVLLNLLERPLILFDILHIYRILILHAFQIFPQICRCSIRLLLAVKLELYYRRFVI